MINVDNELFIREELNGITVYNINHDSYNFYKNIKLSSLINKNKEEVIKYLNDNSNLISLDIDFSYPFRLNWLIEKRCNLNCIYCYANDKMDYKIKKLNINKTLNAIKNLHVLNIGLTGGEPTLSPYLEEIITTLTGKCAIVIDTNGVLPVFEKMIDKIKKANVLVRMSLDSIDENINKNVRPSKIKNENTFEMINHNIDYLINNNINLLIHTVVTTYNKDLLDDIGDYLVSKNVKKWHIYSVNYCDKCKDVHDAIKVDKDELEKIYKRLKKKYQEIEITLESKASDYSKCSIGLIDQEGRFFLDTVYDGIKYVGIDPTNPTPEEYRKSLNISGHIKEYLKLDSGDN